MLELDKIYNMDCMDGMKQLDDNCIDTIITDPPYGLKFMGKKWDYDVPTIKVWKECLRVLKPGGTLLCFAGSRTQHRMAVNVEDAGFILKDCIMWLYGSGFPKAYDIAKGIEGSLEYGSANWKDWNKLDGDLVDSKIGYSKLQHKQGYRDKDYSDKKHNENVKLHTPEARLWSGWKSHGLKPAYEPILVAMKPNDGSYANNALKYGVSGLNIDGGRIEHNEPEIKTKRKPDSMYTKFAESVGGNAGYKKPTNIASPSQKGRFPANILLDEEAAEMLDEQSGIIKTGSVKPHINKTNAVSGFNKNTSNFVTSIHKGDTGGASRFFYCAKASKAERNAGVNGSEKNVGHNRFDKCKKCGGYILQNPDRPSACKCEKPIREHNIIRGNYHPTVKPLKLMEYLCKLTTTPTGGIVLDPFMGSGTTALASRMLNRHFIGFETDKDYYNISLKRLLNIPERLDSFGD